LAIDQSLGFYDFDVCKHIAGVTNVLPVALSRLHAVEPKPIPLECEGHLRLVTPERTASFWKSQVGKSFATHHCMSCRSVSFLFFEFVQEHTAN
jgi:hypothetical protein